jgi:hypothetical protein
MQAHYAACAKHTTANRVISHPVNLTWLELLHVSGPAIHGPQHFTGAKGQQHATQSALGPDIALKLLRMQSAL